MPRPLLDESKVHPMIRDKIARQYTETVQEVAAATERHAVVVVGMALNPFPKKARNALKRAGIAHEYLEYGSYFSEWRRRNALKMWSGWPTFPMVFVRGTLIGGADDLVQLISTGELARTLMKSDTPKPA